VLFGRNIVDGAVCRAGRFKIIGPEYGLPGSEQLGYAIST
jgi:hypothetical protein